MDVKEGQGSAGGGIWQDIHFFYPRTRYRASQPDHNGGQQRPREPPPGAPTADHRTHHE